MSEVTGALVVWPGIDQEGRKFTTQLDSGFTINLKLHGRGQCAVSFNPIMPTEPKEARLPRGYMSTSEIYEAEMLFNA